MIVIVIVRTVFVRNPKKILAKMCVFLRMLATPEKIVLILPNFEAKCKFSTKKNLLSGQNAELIHSHKSISILHRNLCVLIRKVSLFGKTWIFAMQWENYPE